MGNPRCRVVVFVRKHTAAAGRQVLSVPYTFTYQQGSISKLAMTRLG